MNEPDFVGYPMNSGARLQKLAGPYGTVIDAIGVQEALRNPARVLRDENNILRLELIHPNEKAQAIAGKLTGMNANDIAGFRYIVWPYVKKSLWEVDGRP